MNIQSGIKDNHTRGKVGDFLREKIQNGSKLSFVSAYFTIYAYHALKDELDSIDQLRFLFGEPRFIQSLDPQKADRKVLDLVGQISMLNDLIHRLISSIRKSRWMRSSLSFYGVQKGIKGEGL